MENETYNLRITLPEPESGAFTEKDCGKDQSLADAFLFVNILRCGEGTSYKIVGVDSDGTKNSLLSVEMLFNVWIAIGQTIADNGEHGQKTFAQFTSLLARKIFIEGDETKDLIGLLDKLFELLEGYETQKQRFYKTDMDEPTNVC